MFRMIFVTDCSGVDGVTDRLGALKAMSTGVTRYPPGRTEKQADRRGRELPASYRRPLERLDQEYRGTLPGEKGPLVAKLQGFGDFLYLVVGAWGDCSANLHTLVQTCVESRASTSAGLLADQSWRDS